MIDPKSIPVPVWIGAAIIIGMIVIAIVGYGAGLWEPALD
jgi:hypothetical protein